MSSRTRWSRSRRSPAATLGRRRPRRPDAAARVARRWRRRRGRSARRRRRRFRAGGTGRAGAGGGGGVSGLERDPLESENGVRPNRALTCPCARLDAFLRLPRRRARRADAVHGMRDVQARRRRGVAQEKCVRGCIACGSPKASPRARPDAPCSARSTRGRSSGGRTSAPPRRVTEGSRRRRARRRRVRKQASRAAAAVASLSRAELAWRARPDVPELGRLMPCTARSPSHVREKLLRCCWRGPVARRAGRRAVRSGGDQRWRRQGRRLAVPARWTRGPARARGRARASAPGRCGRRTRSRRLPGRCGFGRALVRFLRLRVGGTRPAPSAADDDTARKSKRTWRAAKPQTRAVRAGWCAPRSPSWWRGSSAALASTPAKDAEARAAGSARASRAASQDARRTNVILGFVTPRKDARRRRVPARTSTGAGRKAGPRRCDASRDSHDVCAVTPAVGATPLEMLTGSSSASLEAENPTAQDGGANSGRRALRRAGQRNARDGVPINRSGRGDLATPESDPGEQEGARERADHAWRVAPGVPTKPRGRRASRRS